MLRRSSRTPRHQKSNLAPRSVGVDACVALAEYVAEGAAPGPTESVWGGVTEALVCSAITIPYNLFPGACDCSWAM